MPNIYFVSNVRSYGIDLEQDTLMVDTSTFPVTIYVPNIVASGLNLYPKQFFINDYNQNSANNNITLVPVGGNTINNGVAVVIKTNGANITLSINGPTEWITSGNGAGGGGFTITQTSGITAYAGGGQANATLLQATENRIDFSSAPTPYSSVVLMPFVNGNFPQTAINASSYDINVYPSPGNAFFGLGLNIPILLTAGQQINVTPFNNGVGTIS